MGASITAKVAYGIPIPRKEVDRYEEKHDDELWLLEGVCAVVLHGNLEWDGCYHLLAIRESEYEAYPGDTVKLKLSVKSMWDSQLAQSLKELGIKTRRKPGWHLVCWYG
jgi:hypothetical protein